jgi:hypothetical protein
VDWGDARIANVGGLTSVAELRAGPTRRPLRGTLAAATDEASEGARCSQRDAVQLVSPVPANGPRVSSSAKLAGPIPTQAHYFASQETCSIRVNLPLMKVSFDMSSR